ncbi:hypothetical protein GQ53DRAFT_433468 [Thozetella sp. PMI_491]|nr:hypothetical protein GQ53DRAFT_433468 [Thozetella sp. PMI_491]
MAARELKILTPVSMLGHGFSEPLFWQAVGEGVDAVIVDSGSIDSGPSKLALGTLTVDRLAYERDLGILVAACHSHEVPLLIGSVGGDGVNARLEMFLDIIAHIISSKGYRSMKVLTIPAEIDKATVLSHLEAGTLVPASPVGPALEHAHVADVPRIVAQMGHEPWLRAMQDHPDFDIILAGRSYDPAPYAAFCVWKGLEDLGLAYHMGKIMESGAQCAEPKARELLALVRNDSFDIIPLDPKVRCTKHSVAAHALYENRRPDVLPGPGGILDLSQSTYEELPDGRTVRVRGGQFVPSPPGEYRIKLEGARVFGFQTVFMGGVRDPVLIPQLDAFLARGIATLEKMVPFPHEIRPIVYGRDGVMGPLEPDKYSAPKEVCIMGLVRAGTQEQAAYVAGLARVYLLHAPFQGQTAVGGNLAIPFMPFDIPMGPLTEFCIYHLMPIPDPVSPFPVTFHTLEGPDMAPLRRPVQSSDRGSSIPTLALAAPESPRQLVDLMPAPKPGHAYLTNLARVIRSRNAGPYELTFDVIFGNEGTYTAVRATGALNLDAIKRLYGVSDSDVLACMWWPPAWAFKATIRRPRPSAAFGETDMYGTGQYVPLMYLEVPV